MDKDELKNSLTIEQVKEIVDELGGEPRETGTGLLCRTICHCGDSHKLQYYENTHLFRCYTHCEKSMDIYELISKVKSREENRDYNLFESINYIKRKYNIVDDFNEEKKQKSSIHRLSDSYNILKNFKKPEIIEQKEYSKDLLMQYLFNEKYLKPWINEGINMETLKEFNIMYSILDLAIVIPHRDINGRLIGVRGRFMSDDAQAKYMPLISNGILMNHSLKQNLYGIYENQDTIRKYKTAILFEGEKSVLKYNSYFGKENNIAVATCGNKIAKEQIILLQNLGVKEVMLAYDKDYKDITNLKIIEKKYFEIASELRKYFTVSVIMDRGNLLGYKDSPIDKGPETFKQLYKYRYYISEDRGRNKN